MTKRNYIRIAAAIRQGVEAGPVTPSGLIVVQHIVNAIITELEHDNPRFDRTKFLSACGLD